METARSLRSHAALIIGLVLVTGLIVALQFVPSYDVWAALIIGPLLFLGSIPVLRRTALREGDRRLFWLLVTALALKLAASLLRHYVIFDVYEGGGDAAEYHDRGMELAERFRDGNFSTGLDSLTGANFIRFFTGLVYTVIGPTRFGGFLFFSWLGFWGLFFFYRAFTLAFPGGRAKTYGRLVFFLPSLLFWPSSIGKEAWMTFALGIVALGAARILVGRTFMGLTIAGLGLWMAGLVRPHMAGIAGIALAVSYLLLRPRETLRELAPVAKGLSFLVLSILAVVLIVRTDQFLKDAGIDTDDGIGSSFSQISSRTDEGGSGFAPSVLESPQRLPVVVVTVLFRPMLFEAHNSQSAIAAAEGGFLLLLSLIRAPQMLASLRLLRRYPYLGYALVYVAVFILAFSAVSNFGILVRQRTLLIPLYAVFLAVPARVGRREQTEDRVSSA